MSDSKHIDRLFQSKLAGREVSYSASAWASANQLLNQHYKWLFLRKLLWFLTPIAIIYGIGVGYVADNNAPSGKNNKINYTAIATIEADTNIECFDDEETIYDIKPSTLENSNLDGSLASAESTLILASVPKASNAKQNDLTIETADENLSQNDLGFEVQPPADESKSSKSVKENEKGNDLVKRKRRDLLNDMKLKDRKMISNELARIILNENLDYLPISSLPFSGTQDTSGVFGSDISEPIMEGLRKIQLYAEGGILLANGQHDLNVKRKGPGLGVHASVTAKYHLGESVFLDFRLGVYNRSSLTPTLSFAGSQMNSTINVKPLLINYGSIYIGTGYQIGARHSFGGGLEFNPMISVLARKEKSTIGESASEISYMNDNTGFNGLDAAAILNYRLSITEKMDATAEMHFGLFDATDNAVFNTGDINDLNTLLKLGVSYRVTNR